MKYLFSVLGVVFALFILPVHAAEVRTTAPAQSAEQAVEAQITGYFTALAEQFGCTKLTARDFSGGNVGMLEFLPADQRVESWTRLMTVTVIAVSDEPKQRLKDMDLTLRRLVKTYKTHGKILDTKITTGKNGAPVLYLEYTVGTGKAQERAVGVYGLHGNAISAFVQVQTRGGNVSQADKDAMHGLADHLAGN